MLSTINSTMTARIWAMLITLSILWGGSFFFIGVAVKSLPPLTIVLIRVAIAAVSLWIMAIFMGFRPPKELRIWRAFFKMGLINNVIPFALIVWGEVHIASGLASILNAATPIFAVIVAGLLLPDEKISPLKIVGVALGFIGVVIMLGMPSLQGSIDSNQHHNHLHLFAELAIIAAALSYAFAGVYGRRFKTMGTPPIITAAGQVTASTIILLPITIMVDPPVHIMAIPTFTIIAMLCLGVFSTALAYILYFKILEQAGATNVLLVTLLVPVSAIILGFIFLNEVLLPVHFIGMGLIALGLSAIDGRLWQKFIKKINTINSNT